jgi:hypothetical protein
MKFIQSVVNCLCKWRTLGSGPARSVAAMRIDPLMYILRNETGALATKHRLPMIYPAREEWRRGLIAYWANVPEQLR